MRRSTLLLLVILLVSCSNDSTAGDPARFCEITDELEEVGNFFSLPPDQAEPPARRFLDLIGEAHRVAPPEIRRQVGLIAIGYADLFPDYEAAGFDSTQLDDESIDELFRDDDDVRQAIEAGEIPIEEWVSDNCIPGG